MNSLNNLANLLSGDLFCSCAVEPMDSLEYNFVFQIRKNEFGVMEMVTDNDSISPSSNKSNSAKTEKADGNFYIINEHCCSGYYSVLSIAATKFS